MSNVDSPVALWVMEYASMVSIWKEAMGILDGNALGQDLEHKWCYLIHESNEMLLNILECAKGVLSLLVLGHAWLSHMYCIYIKYSGKYHMWIQINLHMPCIGYVWECIASNGNKRSWNATKWPGMNM